MMLIRPVTIHDLDGVLRLAEQAGIGMTTLPKDRELLAKRLRWAEDSFQKKTADKENCYYLFVMVEPSSGKIVGTTAIESCIGDDAPFYSYKLSTRTRISHELNIRVDYETLNLVNDNQGKTEICTLYLDPEYRISGNGLLLSKSRFLFMATFPELFAEAVIAEMRGVSNAAGESPFWNHLGVHFFKLPFPEADRLTLMTNKQYIADLMPRNPIYIQLLSKEAQEVIGKPHDSTVAALKILNKEGFRYSRYVDIFDGGPTIEAPLKEIHTFKASQLMTIEKIIDEVSSKNYLLSNCRMDYRATKGHVIFNEKEKRCIISKETAELLNLSIGDTMRIAPFQTD